MLQVEVFPSTLTTCVNASAIHLVWLPTGFELCFHINKLLFLLVCNLEVRCIVLLVAYIVCIMLYFMYEYFIRMSILLLSLLCKRYFLWFCHRLRFVVFVRECVLIQVQGLGWSVPFFVRCNSVVSNKSVFTTSVGMKRYVNFAGTRKYPTSIFCVL